MKQTFDQFLQEIHFKIYPQLLDDDIYEHYQNWIDRLDKEEIEKWGNMYGEEQFLAGKSEVLNK